MLLPSWTRGMGALVAADDRRRVRNTGGPWPGLLGWQSAQTAFGDRQRGNGFATHQETPAPLTMASAVPLYQMVAKPRAASARLPVLADPPRRRIRPGPCVIAIPDALSL